MTIAQAQSHWVLPADMPTVVVAGIFLVTLTAWLGLRVVSRRVGDARGVRVAMFLARVAAAFACLLAGMQLSMRFVLLTTNWRLWLIALGGGLAVESLLGLYGLERGTVSRGAGLKVAGLRVLGVLLVVAMLCQPVVSWELTEQLDRHIAVLIDTSASMQVRDPQRDGADKLRLGEILSPSTPRRPVRLERARRAAGLLRARLVAAADDLAVLADFADGARRRQLASRREALHDDLVGARKDTDALGSTLSAARAGSVRLDADTARRLDDVQSQLAGGVAKRIDRALALTAPEAAGRLAQQYEPLLKALRGATAALSKIAAEIAPIRSRYDEVFYASLSGAQKRTVEAVTDRTRLELARALLVARTADSGGAEAASLLEKLQAGYEVRLYEFARHCNETDAEAVSIDADAVLLTSGPPSLGTDGPTTTAADTEPLASDAQATDLAGAIERVTSDISASELAGIIILTDGRHNAPVATEPFAARMGLAGVPICSVVMAPSRPPCDAAVLSVDAPQTVVAGDSLLIQTELKLDGLAGRAVTVTLADGAEQVAMQTVRVPAGAASYRTRLLFSDEPAGVSSPGGRDVLHGYTVRIQPQDGEVFLANNDRPLTVSVTGHRTRVLLVDDRPRWEFRYLKNMFDDRDRSVKLQYVLLHPDSVEGGQARPVTHASAARPDGQTEATALPAGASEWMKFDVIVLGDVPRKALKPWQLDTLRRFVSARGGTLVVIAGPNFMPHDYGRTSLAEILPVRLKPGYKPADPGARAGQRIALTSGGRDHPVMFQEVNQADNEAVWASFPPIYWRHTGLLVNEAATVLACAVPLSARDLPRPPPSDKVGNDSSGRRGDQRSRYPSAFERANPLIVVQKVAAGQVMALCFDRTWRMRYRAGDTHHHRFWGQVMRWATADKLSGGTDRVQVGTDRTRYEPDRPVRARARILRADLSPVLSQDVAVKVFRGEKLLLRRRLEYQPASAGLYEALLGTLGSGEYRVELDAPAAEAILVADNAPSVWAEFAVDAVGGPENLELGGDNALLARLANLSGGVALAPDQVDQLVDSLGSRSTVHRQRRELRLWDSWQLLVLIMLAVGMEWFIRKRTGLA